MSARVEPASVSAKAKLGALEITDKDKLLLRNSAVKSGISQTADENWKEYTRDNRLLHPDHRHPRETVDTQDGELCAVGASRAKTLSANTCVRPGGAGSRRKSKDESDTDSSALLSRSVGGKDVGK